MATHTTFGTPCARSWSEDWIAAVNHKETELNHRICGARLSDATPCTNESDHPSGRCPYHGGFDLTGAPRGNRNGVIHGLYSRRLRTCTPNCPYWQTCPIANATYDATGIADPAEQSAPACISSGNPKSKIENPKSPTSISSMPSILPADPPDPSNFPSNPKSKIQNPKSAPALTCPYQLVEYNTVLTDALAIVESQPHPNPMGIHAAHNIATLQVLISTAAATLTATNLTGVYPSNADLTAPSSSVCGTQYPEPGPRPDSHSPQTPNPNAILAFIRLMREFRASLKMLATPLQTPLSRQKNNFTPPSPEGVMRHIERAQHDTQIDPDSLIDSQIDGQPEHLHAKAYLRQSIEAASQGRDVDMAEAFDNVILLDEHLAESERDHVLASYRPAKHSVSEELAAHILGNLHLPPLVEHQETENTNPHVPSDDNSCAEYTKVLQEYLDLFRDGRIPPEAFPIDTPIRAHAESIYTGTSPKTSQTAPEQQTNESP